MQLVAYKTGLMPLGLCFCKLHPKHPEHPLPSLTEPRSCSVREVLTELRFSSSELIRANRTEPARFVLPILVCRDSKRLKTPCSYFIGGDVSPLFAIALFMWQTFLGSDYSGIVHYIALHYAPLHCALCIVTLPLVFALLRESSAIKI